MSTRLFLFLNFVTYFCITPLTAAELGLSQIKPGTVKQVLVKGVLISDKHLKAFFKKEGLKIASQWQDAVDSLSDADINFINTFLPFELLDAARKISTSIQKIISSLSQEEVEQLLGISCIDTFNTVTCVNLIQNFKGEIIRAHKKHYSNFTELRQALADCIARQFSSIDLLHRRTKLDDQSLLDEPYCTLYLSKTNDKNRMHLMKTQFFYLHEGNRFQNELKQKLFDLDVPECICENSAIV